MSKILITASLTPTNGSQGNVWIDYPIEESEWNAMDEFERQEMCEELLQENTTMKYRVNTDYVTLMAHGLTKES